MKKSELRNLIREELSKTEIDRAERIRTMMPGYVGRKFAKVASTEDIVEMVKLRDERADIVNRYILPIQRQIEALQKRYRIRTL